MNRRTAHVGKSKQEKRNYLTYIKWLDYEPTVDETLGFAESDEPGEDLTVPTLKRKRSINTKQHVMEYFSENWLNYVIGLIALTLVFLMYDSKLELAKIDVGLAVQKENISSIKSDTKQQGQENHAQDIKINENRYRIDSLEKRLEDVKVSIRK